MAETVKVSDLSVMLVRKEMDAMQRYGVKEFQGITLAGGNRAPIPSLYGNADAMRSLSAAIGDADVQVEDLSTMTKLKMKIDNMLANEAKNTRKANR